MDSQGEKTNPTTATVMADTDTIDSHEGGGGIYEVLAVASASADAEFVIQRRNTANSANVGDTVTFYVPAKGTVSVPFRFEVERGERIRIMMDTNLTGVGVATVQVQRVA